MKESEFKSGDIIEVCLNSTLASKGDIGVLVYSHSSRNNLWTVDLQKHRTVLYEREFKLVPKEEAQLLSL
jgi:hypothetical protein